MKKKNYKNSRKKSIKEIENLLKNFDDYSNMMNNIRDSLQGSIYQIEDGIGRKLVANELDKQYHDLRTMLNLYTLWNNDFNDAIDRLIES